MNDIRDLLPNRMRERTFQLKAKRDAGAVWHEPQFVECKQCGRRAARTLWARSLYVCPNCGYHMPIGGYYRLSLVLDHGSFRELDADLDPQVCPSRTRSWQSSRPWVTSTTTSPHISEETCDE